jgi:hypothetical protein
VEDCDCGVRLWVPRLQIPSLTTATAEIRMMENTVPNVIRAKIQDEGTGGGKVKVTVLVVWVLEEVWLCVVDVVTVVASVLVTLTKGCI